MLLVGQEEGHLACKNWVVECWCGSLKWGADLHIAQLMLLPLTVSCSRLVLPFWYWHTWVVPENTHTLSTSSIYNDPWHPLCSVYELDSPHVQPLQVLFGLLVPSTSYSIHFFTQPSSFRRTCPYQRSLFYCNTNAVTQSLSQLTWVTKTKDKGPLNSCVSYTTIFTLVLAF